MSTFNLHVSVRPGKDKDLETYERLDHEYAGSYGLVPIVKLLTNNHQLTDWVILGNYIPIGHIVFTPSYGETEIVRFAISCDYWGRGIGTQVIENFINVQKGHRSKISVRIPGKNVGDQIFFNKLGFNVPRCGGSLKIDGKDFVLMEYFVEYQLSPLQKNRDHRYEG